MTEKSYMSERELRLKTEAKEQVQKLLNIISAKKGLDIVAINVEDKTIIAEWFVICSGSSVIQVKSICDEIESKYAELGLSLRRSEGYAEGRWIVLDFAYILVHIFHPDEREYYNMERLWMSPETEIIRVES